ncbi:MAG: DUF1579 domain-containing protein [Hyphomicrobiaceae bacterium]|nr:DUF1579 domain-containing protein [Hyphomicrobiaceae bacterium]MCC0024268.1 DUF1579 domain-containing protein [Hyphomicrobiaceae bacterium]
MTGNIGNEFEFLFGTWQVAHRRLRHRLQGSNDWDSFAGTSTTRPVLNGMGNIEDNLIDHPDGTYRAIAIRSFDLASGNWAIWWLDGRAPHQLDKPVIGSFRDGVGNFTCKDTYEGRDILVRFIWKTFSVGACRWEQAFSPDNGQSWETNWVMQFART